MFQPSPVTSSGGNALNNNGQHRQHQQRLQHSSPSYVLANSPHPILDGVDQQHNSVRNQQNQNGGSRNNDHDGKGEIPSKRSYYPTDSEFINDTAAGDARGTNDVVEKDKNSATNIKEVKIKSEEVSSDDNNNQSDDEEEQDEFDEATTEIPTLDTYIPREPSYEKANAVPFRELCRRLEVLWSLNYRKSKRASKVDRLEYLLPDTMMKYLDGGSPFPYLRLILPDHDSSRAHTGMKEAKIADTWIKAMGLGDKNQCAKKLKGYRDKRLVKDMNSVGDLSCVVMDVMKERMPGNGSKLTVGEVNEWLDVLVDIVKDRFEMATEDHVEKSSWRKSLEKAILSQPRHAKKGDKYAKLVEKLTSKNLSPVEHKFIVRILLQHIHVGINLKDIIGWMSPHAVEIYNSFSSLKDLCTRLSDPEYIRLLKATVEKNTHDIMENNRNIWMTPSTLPSKIGLTISPMLSRRTTFHTFLKEIAHRHSQLEKALPAESPAKSCLAIKHPAFACEIKMDGERDLIHIKRGEVTIQTRNGTWYSPLYSPAIGPSLRAAIAGYDIDVILDGEMIAYDDSEGKPIPFGSNRAVAEMNRNQRIRDGTLDKRDLDLHKNDTEINVMTLAKSKGLKSFDGTSKNVNGVADDKYWLQYVVFDILYVDGPGAKDLLAKSSHLFPKDETISPGSLINMDCMQRKSILYNLIQPQKNIVEHIRSVVVRSDGSSMDAADYFLGRGRLEYGKTPCELDSIYLAMCDKSGTTKFDSQRCGKTHEEIEIQRSFALEQLYNQIVDTGGQEGLIFKDLASPYYLGATSRSMGYWWKLKPDYDESGKASDIDLLVLGGRYADGFDKRGLLSSVIVGCLDSSTSYESNGGDDPRFVAVSKVNFNRNTAQVLFQNTGYQREDENGLLQLGRWFESEDVPDFMSSKSYQRHPNGDKDGWKPEKKDRPDLWIRPEDSFVVTINAGEFQTSSSMQAGFSLRFPRISRYRGKGDPDPKDPDQVETYLQLDQLFLEQDDGRQEEVSFGSQTQQQTSRFLTAKQLQMSGKEKAAKNARKQTNEVKQFHIPEADAPLSSVLNGFIFNVQPGNYYLENDAFAAAEAEENGWATDAKSVKSQKDVIRFIQSHGGTCQLAVNMKTDFLLGGSFSDAPVSNLRILMAETNPNSTTKKDADARRLLEMGGVLKWTFVYSIVSKFLKHLDDDASGYEKSIKTDWPSLANPRRSDFLVMSDTAKTTLHATEDEFGLRINATASSIDFARALEEVGRQKTLKRANGELPWQSHAMNSFNGSERWVFGGRAQKLWPYAKHAGENSAVCILYPDLFNDLGLEEKEDADKEALRSGVSPRWKDAVDGSKSLGQVTATLPLAKALGAIVTPHLHIGVTHVLCDLKRHKMLKWSSMHPLSIYSNAQSGSHLQERLISLEESAALDGDSDFSVLLVSPDWLEEKWNEEE